MTHDSMTTHDSESGSGEPVAGVVSRTLKLQLTAGQVEKLNGLLWQYSGVYNWAVRKLFLDGQGGRFYSRDSLFALVSGQAARAGLNLKTMRGILLRALQAHHGRGIRSRSASLKGQRNRLNSLPLLDRLRWVDRTHFQVPGMGPLKVRPGKDFPEGAIKAGVLSRRARGWYLTLQVEAEPRSIPQTDQLEAGVDFGFARLATLSTGEVIENPREYQRMEARLGQADRGQNSRLLGALHQRLANARRCRNHAISRDLLSRHRTLYLSRDNYRALQRIMGKSTTSAAIGQLIRMLHAKSRPGGRRVIEVSNRNSTRGCSTCGALTGPTGRRQLSVRFWICGACGAHHDRDVNAAVNAFRAGAVLAHEMAGNRQSETRPVPGNPTTPLDTGDIQ